MVISKFTKIFALSLFLISPTSVLSQNVYNLNNEAVIGGVTGVLDGQGTVKSDGTTTTSVNTFIGTGNSLDSNSFFLYDLSSIGTNQTIVSATLTFFAAPDSFYFSRPDGDGGHASSETVLVNAFTSGETGLALYNSIQDEVNPIGQTIYNTAGASGAMTEFTVTLTDLSELQSALGGDIGLGASLLNSDGSGGNFGLTLGGGFAPATSLEIVTVPEVSASGVLAAFGSVIALMAFLWERRRVAYSTV